MSHSDNSRRGRWSRSAAAKYLRRVHNRADRFEARRKLRKGEQPESVQSRHRALWDAS